MRTITKLALVAGSAAAVLAAMAGPAIAEPPPTPSATTYVAAGSDTLQAVEDQFQTDYVHTPNFVSYDATGTASITAKPTCTSITRPNGSGGGITNLGLNAKTTAGANYCINVARSSRSTQAGDPAGLSWLDLAADAVSWAAKSGGNAPANLTHQQLYHIFHCDAGYTTWNGTGLGNGTGSTATVYPLLPQSASGTRAFFLLALNKAMGMTGSLVPGTCVDTSTAPEENEGTNAIFTGTHGPNIVYPYSAAVYAAQVFNGHGAGTQGTLTIRNIDGVSPVTTSGTPRTENPSFNSSYQRIVYNVIRTAAKGTTTTADGSVYADLVGPAGWECTNTTAQTDLKSYGFGLLGTACGAVGAHT